jgi:molybdate transport system ATP-binding protein
MSKQPIAHIDVTWPLDGTDCRTKFSLMPGVTALIGPSGAGKTTVARILCGLESKAKGSIQIFGETLLSEDGFICVPTKERKIGLSMQDPALFPTLNVRENIMLGSKLNACDIQGILDVTLTKGLMDRMPATLSGGEARRVAIVRAMVAAPSLLILDEPMNGLDPKRRREIMALIRELAHKRVTPVLLITHQLEEMLFAADHALLIDGGEILCAGPVEAVLSAPKTAELLGIDDAGSLLAATVVGREDGLLTTDIGGETLFVSDDNEPIGATLRLRILARDIALSPGKLREISVLNQLEATVTAISQSDKDGFITLKLAKSGHQLQSRITKKSLKNMKLSVGLPLFCLIKAVAVKELLSENPARN